jgi:hypothetical protein
MNPVACIDRGTLRLLEDGNGIDEIHCTLRKPLVGWPSDTKLYTEAQLWAAAHAGAEQAMSDCKAATGLHSKVNMYVLPIAIAHRVCKTDGNTRLAAMKLVEEP